MRVFLRGLASRFLISSLSAWLLILLAAGCGTTTTGGTDDVVDLDGVNASDIDLDGVDVDQDTLSKLDIKQDTIGLDAQDSDGTDAISPDAADTADIATGCTSTAACDDKNPCTDDTCGKDGVCVHANNTGDCTDGNACTSGDVCAAGVCAGTAKKCFDDNPCTTDSCDKATGCVFLPNAVTCDDGIACTLADTCIASACVGVPDAATCSDGNACTTDTCDVASGKCVNLNNDITCTDGDACTTGDVCNGGTCTATTTDCDDKNVCTIDSCDGESGNCVHSANNDAVCDDGDPCTTAEYCSNKSCLSDGSTNCNDQNDCTLDTCSPAIGCVHTKQSDTMCNDGNACTFGDWCSEGTCLAGDPSNCNDDNKCTDDSCNPDNGACVNLANAVTCDDGDPCTLADTCTQTVCEGTPNSCSQLPYEATSTCQFSYCDYNDGSCKTANYGPVWSGTFATKAGWKLQGEWQIGLAAASTDQTAGNADPTKDYDGDNYLAGTAIGGNISNTPHDWYYLTSPVIDLSMYATSTYLDYTTNWAYDHSMIFEFNWFANMSGVAGQYMTLEFSNDGKTWVPSVVTTTDSFLQGWSYAYQFYGQDEIIPKAMLSKHFQFRFGYKIVNMDGIIPVVSGMSLDAPQVWVGNCWD